LNDQLAKKAQSTYVPAVSRAEQLMLESSVVAGHVKQNLEEMMSHLKPDVPSIPRVSLLLLRRAKGDPAGVVNEALEMRERTRWARGYLARRTEQLRLDPTAPDPDFKRKAEFEHYIRVALGLEKEVKFLDSVDIGFDVWGLLFFFALGLPPVTLNGGKLAEWIKQGIWKRRLVVLTDLAHTPCYQEVDEIHLRTFVERCTGRAFADCPLMASARSSVPA
jgi:hypothetical protein